MTVATQEVPVTTPAPIILVLTAPKRAFLALAYSPRFLTALLFVVAGAVASTLVISHYVDISATVEQAPAYTSADPVRRAQLLNAAAIMARIAPITSSVGLLITLAAIAAVLFVALAIAGHRATFRRVFAITVHAWVPMTLKWLFVSIVVALRGQPIVGDAGNLLKSSAAALLGLQPNSYAERILLSLTDFFQIWCVALFVIGIAAVASMQPKKVAVLVAALWFATALLQFR
jgi:hypothetical protein